VPFGVHRLYSAASNGDSGSMSGSDRKYKVVVGHIFMASLFFQSRSLVDACRVQRPNHEVEIILAIFADRKLEPSRNYPPTRPHRCFCLHHSEARNDFISERPNLGLVLNMLSPMNRAAVCRRLLAASVFCGGFWELQSGFPCCKLFGEDGQIARVSATSLRFLRSPLHLFLVFGLVARRVVFPPPTTFNGAKPSPLSIW